MTKQLAKASYQRSKAWKHSKTRKRAKGTFNAVRRQAKACTKVIGYELAQLVDEKAFW